MVGDRNPDPEAPSMRKRWRERVGSKEDVRGGATASGVMEKGGCVRTIEGEEVRADDPVEYFLPTWVEVPFESQRG